MSLDRALIDEFIEILGAIRDESLQPEQYQRLQSLLSEYAELRRLYVLHTQLMAEFWFGESFGGMPKGVGSVDPGRRGRSPVPSEQNDLLWQMIERDREEIRACDPAHRFHRDRYQTEAPLDADTHTAASLFDEGFTDQGEIWRFAQKSLHRFQEEESRRQEELYSKLYRTQRRRRMIAISSLAALVVILVFVWFAPDIQEDPPTPTTPPVVASIGRSIDARWDRSDFSVVEGTRLTASPMFLQQGLVQIIFDSGVEAILQAPCDLHLEGPGSMLLNSGTLSASVPPHAVGFRIQTPMGIITDFGTEFGVIARNNGLTETHVYDGKVVLESISETAQSVGAVELKRGQAAGVDNTGRVQRRPFRAHSIVRTIPEKAGFAIPGKRMNLADVVGGGNGFETGKPGFFINPMAGVLSKGMPSVVQGAAYTQKLIPVVFSPFIDGVFIPDGDQGSVQVSSKNHRFTNCPDTGGRAIWGIGYDLDFYYEWADHLYGPFAPRLNNQTYGTRKLPAINMHANLGVTFDLTAMRRALPEVEIVRFTALTGICQNALSFGESRAGFWVLLDGDVVYERIANNGDVALRCNVDIDASHEFLTLVTTDGGDTHALDWCLFAEPALELQVTRTTQGVEKGQSPQQ